MMLRFTFAARIALIILVGLLVLWIGVVALYYRAAAHEGEISRPAPARVAALATLAERAALQQRALLLRAVSGADLTVGVAPAGTVSPAPPPLGRRDRKLQAQYAAALDGRSVALSHPPVRPDARFPRLAKMVDRDIALRVGLRTGETLVLETRAPVPVTPFGLPIGFGAGLIGTVVALLALLIMQRETRPLARLAAAVDKVDLTAEPAPLPSATRSAPEIRALIAAFARLQQRLSETLRARMTLVGGIAHDVRTFATRLRLRVERLPDEQERARAIADIDDMIVLLDDALLSARVGAGELSREMLDLAALLRTDIDDRVAQGGPVTWQDGLPAGTVVLGDRLALRRVFANVIDNALAYGRRASVAASQQGEMAVVTVDDEGPGIPADQRGTMFQPFNRLEASRNRATGGAGLGLAVVRSLVEAHEGTVEIAEAPGGGARVVVSLPVFRV